MARASVNNNTALHWAAQEGNAAALQAILKRFPRIDIDVTGPTKSTPLLLAASYGRAEIVRELLRRGASAMARNTKGQTPALSAALSGDVETIKSFTRERIAKDRILCAGLIPFLRYT